MNPLGFILIYAPPGELALATLAAAFIAGAIIAAAQIAMGRA